MKEPNPEAVCLRSDRHRKNSSNRNTTPPNGSLYPFYSSLYPFLNSAGKDAALPYLDRLHSLSHPFPHSFYSAESKSSFMLILVGNDLQDLKKNRNHKSISSFDPFSALPYKKRLSFAFECGNHYREFLCPVDDTDSETAATASI